MPEDHAADNTEVGKSEEAVDTGEVQPSLWSLLDRTGSGAVAKGTGVGAEDAAEGREGAAQEAAAAEEAQEEPAAAVEEVAAARSEVAAKQDEPFTLTQEDNMLLDGTAEAEAPQSVCNTYFIHVCMHYIQCV